VPGVICTSIWAGVVPADGETASQLLVELVARVKVNCWFGSELVRVKGFPLVGPNCTGRPPCGKMSDCIPVGIPTFSRGLLLMKSVTPISAVVVPLVGVFELTVTFPVQLPELRLVVTMLTVSVAGVVFEDKDAWNQPPGQLLVGAVVMLKERGSETPVLVIVDVWLGGPI
jgi:hypothetical protein